MKTYIFSVLNLLLLVSVLYPAPYSPEELRQKSFQNLPALIDRALQTNHGKLIQGLLRNNIITTSSYFGDQKKSLFHLCVDKEMLESSCAMHDSARLQFIRELVSFGFSANQKAVDGSTALEYAEGLTFFHPNVQYIRDILALYTPECESLCEHEMLLDIDEAFLTGLAFDESLNESAIIL